MHAQRRPPQATRPSAGDERGTCRQAHFPQGVFTPGPPEGLQSRAAAAFAELAWRGALKEEFVLRDKRADTSQRPRLLERRAAGFLETAARSRPYGLVCLLQEEQAVAEEWALHTL